MASKYSITEYFGVNLAEFLSNKIVCVFSCFNSDAFIQAIKIKCVDKSYTQRIELFANELKNYLPGSYNESVNIILKILGPENPNQTGMFKHYYWVLPLGKYVEKFGLECYDLSMYAISEITKRNTGEYAIRPYIRKYPLETLKLMSFWAQSDSFHLRRLASEGLRPKLPWASKLDTFIDNPEPVFKILEHLKEDEILLVKKSVANHLTDWLKVNPQPVSNLIRRWSASKNHNTKWIVKHATRKISIVE